VAGIDGVVVSGGVTAKVPFVPPEQSRFYA
jgi:hypothetical protein